MVWGYFTTFIKAGNSDATSYINLDLEENESIKSSISADKEKVTDMYFIIHAFKIKLLNKIIEEIDFEVADLIICSVRHKFENGTIVKGKDIINAEDVFKNLEYVSPELKEDSSKKSIFVIGNDFLGFTNIVVAKTSTEISYDEDLMLKIKKDGREYFIDIQIEHSENKENHKSNLDEELRNCLSTLTKYIHPNYTKFI